MKSFVGGLGYNFTCQKGSVAASVMTTIAPVLAMALGAGRARKLRDSGTCFCLGFGNRHSSIDTNDRKFSEKGKENIFGDPKSNFQGTQKQMAMFTVILL